MSRFLRELWGEGDQPAEVVHCGRAHRVELSGPPVELVIDAEGGTDLTVAIGGLVIGTFRLEPSAGRVSPGQLRATVTRRALDPLIRGVVSAAILGRPADDGFPLRDRLQQAAEHAEESNRHTRLVRVPITPAAWLRWREIQPHPTRRARRLALTLPPSQRRLARRLYDRGTTAAAQLRVLLPGPGIDRVPILMYHRVAPAGAARMSRWRVTPELFGRQLAALAAAGFTGISMEQLREIQFEGADCPSRPVVLTFDDGYQDFADHALPALVARDFRATVFVVAGEVGETNRWDDVFDDPADLMDWNTLRTLTEHGIDLGSHTVSHPAMTAFGTSAMTEQAVLSKEMIEEGVERPVTSFAYPYGDYDRVVADVVGQAGYALAVTCDRGFASPFADPMQLPRLEVTGSTTAVQLLGLLWKS